MPKDFNLFPNSNIFYQLTSDELESISLKEGTATKTNIGAIAVNTGFFTGRSPKDRFIVKDEITKDSVFWGEINIPFNQSDFSSLKNKIINYLNGKNLYARDCFAGADKSHQLSIRIINEYSWSNMFAYNMFIQPSEEELTTFNVEWTIYNAPGFLAEPKLDKTRQSNFSIIDFSKKEILIGGTAYTGEIKKGIFSALNFLLPFEKNILPMHCSANVGKNGDTALFFGLSGTGKTTLSSDFSRNLIGDDEHGWDAELKIFNFEGGCYAKVLDLNAEKEPEIYAAIRNGALLENVIVDKNGDVDFYNDSITQNTRVSYPLSHIKNIQTPSVGSAPKNIFFLTADAFGVLPPISKLTSSQAAYHFISGYTAKIPGTEKDVIEPTPSFSACFGAPFMPLHPSYYAEMLSKKIAESNANVWMINTGWTGGGYGVGKRINLKYTRLMINAVLEGKLDDYTPKDFHIHSVFGLAQIRHCPGIPNQILSPRISWANDEAYYQMAFKLANAFRDNFKKFEKGTSNEIIKAGPIKFS